MVYDEFLIDKSTKKPCKHCLVEKVKETGKSQIEEITTADGKTFLVNFFPIKDKENNIVAIF